MIDGRPSRDPARGVGAPTIVDPAPDQAFRALAERRGMDPNARFVGGYVEWEWRHARHLFESGAVQVEGRAVLELGCNVGATAIVLATLGAEVTAVDPDAGLVELARANAARYGVGDRVRFVHVPDTTRLPFADESFAWVSCNSVLEYIPPQMLTPVLREVDRVLAPGGVIAVLGTSNRLWPREQHSRRWLVNYVPSALDRLLPGPPPRRGIMAGRVRRVLRDYDDRIAADGGALFVDLKARMGAEGLRLAFMRRAARLLAHAGISPGVVGPTLTMLLQKA